MKEDLPTETLLRKQEGDAGDVSNNNNFDDKSKEDMPIETLLQTQEGSAGEEVKACSGTGTSLCGVCPACRPAFAPPTGTLEKVEELVGRHVDRNVDPEKFAADVRWFMSMGLRRDLAPVKSRRDKLPHTDIQINKTKNLQMIYHLSTKNTQCTQNIKNKHTFKQIYIEFKQLRFHSYNFKGRSTHSVKTGRFAMKSFEKTHAHMHEAVMMDAAAAVRACQAAPTQAPSPTIRSGKSLTRLPLVKLQLPGLNLEHNDDYEAARTLVDSGSSVHVVDAEKVFPGAASIPPKKGASGYKPANGGTVSNLGSAEMPCVTTEAQSKHDHWIHANVAMPILSTKLLTHSNGELRYRTEGVVL